MTRSESDSKLLWAVNLTAFLVALYFLAANSIHAGHAWGGDFSLYIMHARNIAEGLPYGATPYVRNVLHPFHSPASYPPVYPLLLAPVYGLFGLDFKALKLATCLFLPLSGLALYGFARASLPPTAAFVVVAIAGLNPLVFSLRNEVLPILPFTFFALSTLWVGSAADDDDASSPRRQVWFGVALGTLAYLAYGTRSLGLALPAALALHDLRAYRRLLPRTYAMLAVFVSLALAANRWTGYSDNSYYQMLREFTPGTILNNAIEYVRLFAFAWDGGFSKIVRYALFFLTLPLAVTGFGYNLRLNHSSAELFFLVYAAILLAWPGATGAIYVAPLLPLYFFYIVEGAWLIPRARTAVKVVLLLAVSGVYTASYAVAAPPNPTSGILLPDFQALCAQITRGSVKSDLFVFWNPRVLALMTGRRATPYAAQNPDVVWRHIRDSGANYVIVTRFQEDDRRFLLPALSAHAGGLDQIYANPSFILYRVKNP